MAKKMASSLGYLTQSPFIQTTVGSLGLFEVGFVPTVRFSHRVVFATGSPLGGSCYLDVDHYVISSSQFYPFIQTTIQINEN